MRPSWPGRVWPAHLWASRGQTTKQTPDSPAWLLSCFPGTELGGGMAAAQTGVAGKALAWAEFTCWFLATNQKHCLPGWVLSLSLNEGPQACAPHPLHHHRSLSGYVRAQGIKIQTRSRHSEILSLGESVLPSSRRWRNRGFGA